MSVTEADIIAAIRAAQQSAGPESHGLTTAEIAEAMGVPATRVLKWLKPVVKSGAIVSTRVMRQRIDGVWNPTVGWRLAA